MIPLAQLYSPIAAELEEARRIFREELASDQPSIRELCGHIERLHGKLVRPALLLLCARACGGVRPEHLVLAAVVEMVHISTLVHDDVLDEAEVRRRAATVNHLWGNERAVLLGDYLISHAFHLCSGLGDTFAARLIGRTCNTVCEGELMQVANRDNPDLSEQQYLDIITRKTASLIGACTLLGARYAGADEATVQRMHEFGLWLGVAFQIADDLLDLIGDEAEVGKSLGRDLAKGKLTLAVIHCLRQARPDGRERLLEFLRGGAICRNGRIARLLAESNSIDYARQSARSYVERARQALSCLPPSEAREVLGTMAEFSVSRRL
jgi:octaprenyl-diphosphate synthase